ncbi:MAG: phenylacetate-CoA oxygenase/reductase subunit PaaK [Terrimonas sp.]|nr:phenylacetate-CoA oxygenase/reductase subunit PaaK [Terrimonas sp.]
MSIHFHKLTVKAIHKETPDAVSILFEVPDDLKKKFSYKQGQNLTVRTFLDNEEVRRTYSLCSSPLDPEWKVAVKKVEGGLFSCYANEQLKNGDTLEVMEPVGKFYTKLEPSQKKNYLAVAAGSGITPILSIIKTTLRTELNSQFTLVYGNKTRSSVMFFEELEAIKNKYLERFTLIHVLSRERTTSPLNFGRINPEKLQALNRIIDFSGIDAFFICGPEALIFTTKDFLEKNGIDKKKIHFELFSTQGPVKSITRNASADRPEGAETRITIQLDGRSFEFGLPLNSETPILDAALKKGADLPYACKGGMCCTCKAKLLEGKVTMDVHWGLEEEELENGFILTCQSHPDSEKVVIDFDIK